MNYQDRSEASVELTDKMYQEICNHALQAVGARWVQFTGFDADTGIVHQLGMSQWNSRRLQRAARAAKRLLPGMAIVRVSPRVTDNPLLREVYELGHPVESSLREIASGVVPRTAIRLAELAGLRWTLSYPMVLQGQVIGALAFHSSRAFTAQQRGVATAFVKLALLTVENHRLYTERRAQVELLRASRERMVEAEERVRQEVAERLHGTLQTRLLIVWHRLGETLQAVQDDIARAQVEDVRQMVERIREDDVRRLSHRLHPPVLAIGLLPALRSLGAQMAEVIDVGITADEEWGPWDDPLDNNLSARSRLAIYRVVEEALNNAHRHGHAGRVTVHLGVQSEGIQVTVSDNGQGFRPDDVEKGLGWWSMDGYVSDLGGHFEIESAPERGTTLTVRLPLPHVPLPIIPGRETGPAEPAD
ncbi:MAG: sensor histidine kinase [Thermaerobacter sp.]|nr:sensor histidine kinase [Thermaerobacter sp.]